VLVVEDDDSLRGALERLLGLAGFSALAYASAEAVMAGGLAEGAACVVSNRACPECRGSSCWPHFARAAGGRRSS
jgi:FixJ family two-component response regulator